MPSLKHKFRSAKADGTDATFVKPSNWNDEHDLVSTGAAVYLGREPSAAGPVQEFPIDHAASGDDMTMMTKAQVAAAIQTAVETYSAFSPGDLMASMASSKLGGWALLNGQTIGNVASGATIASVAMEALFKLFWAINGATWPILDATGTVTTRGASADADWLSTAPYKRIALPDARGCVIGMVDLTAGVNQLIDKLGVKVGVKEVTLAAANLVNHTHSIPYPSGYYSNLGDGGSIGGSHMAEGTPANGTSGGMAGTLPTPTPVNLTQPTMGANLFIKY